MKRVTPEEVKAAYQQTGLIPERGDYIEEKDDGKLCGCAMGALALAHGIEPKYRYVRAWAIDTYGFRYVSSFVSGFDDEHVNADVRIPEAYADGKAAAKVVFLPDLTSPRG